MEDHHVDRPGVEAWQHVKLTGPNRSIGLILCARRQVRETSNMASDDCRKPVGSQARHASLFLRARCRYARPAMFFDDLVVMARGETPDPIPNSAVKTLSADGTASQGVGE